MTKRKIDAAEAASRLMDAVTEAADRDKRQWTIGYCCVEKDLGDGDEFLELATIARTPELSRGRLKVVEGYEFVRAVRVTVIEVPEEDEHA